MKSGKPIDISKASLVSLKTELIRKKEEAEKLRGSENYVKLPPKPKPIVKANPGVSSRNEGDLAELSSEEIDLLQKSKDVLVIKSSLYEQLQRGALVSEDGQSRYLVDFENKKKESVVQTIMEQRVQSPLQEDSVESDEEFGESSDWVEYKDCLGRSRQCLRSDLALMKERDKALSSSILKEPDKKETELEEVAKELVPDDMHLEELRKKWEEKEKQLLNKQNVHYEDILFDEARSHGVGYWKFSTDEAKRVEEQEMLRKVRQETEQKQKEAKALRERREQQRQQRLIAARQRQRARLGLPPIDPTQILKTTKAEEEEAPKKENPEEEEEVKEDLEIKLKKAAHVRPWDLGKDGVQQPVMTQEEWVEKKREERTKEFAPSYEEDSLMIQPEEQIKKKKKKKKTKVQQFAPILEPAVEESNPMFSRTKHFLAKRKLVSQSEEINVGATTSTSSGVEIPPPMVFSYFNPESSNRGITKAAKFKDTADAIEAGLELLRQQAEISQKATSKQTEID